MNALMELGNMLDTGVMNAVEITHALCELGNGSSMGGDIQLGILGGFPVGLESGWKSGHTKGLLTGAAAVAGGAAVACLCVWGSKKYKAKKTKNMEDAILDTSNTIDCDNTSQETVGMAAV